MKLNKSNGILWRKSGFRLELARGTIRNADNLANPFHTLYVGDLNPEQEIVTGLTRGEAIKVGFWFIARAFFPTPPRGINDPL